jgi:hypothetical protein
MPGNAYNNISPINSIFSEQTADKITGLGSEPLDTTGAETTIAPSPVYEALYGNNEPLKTTIPFEISSATNTVTESPSLSPKTDADKRKTALGEKEGLQPPLPGADSITTLSSTKEDDFITEVYTAHESN